MESHCIKQTGIPHATRLFTDFLYQFDRVSGFYSFPPFDPSSLLQAAENLKAGRYPVQTREAVAAVMAEQDEAVGAGDATRQNIARFRAGAVAVVTGQQVGLFTGPMFAVYKALTAVKLAERLTAGGLDCVPVFWLATEDHDLAEVNHTFVMDAAGRPQRVTDQSQPHVENAPVGEVRLGPGIAAAVAAALAPLPSSPWTDEVARALHESYQPGETYGRAFARLMNRLLGRFGVLTLDPTDPRMRRLAAPVFRQAIEDAPKLGAALLARDRELSQAGYHAQVHVTGNSALLFQRHQGQRIALRRTNGDFLRGEEQVSRQDLLARLDANPEDFSSNVLLRPIVQDTLLPTVAYVGGPAEVAYMAQVAVLYREMLGRMPVVYPRASLTLLDARAADLLAHYRICVTDVFDPDVEEKMAERLLPEKLAAAFATGAKRMSDALGELERQLQDFDPTLADAMATSGRKMVYQWDKVRRKASRTAGSRSRELARDSALLQGLAYPNKNLQERVYSGISLLAHFGPDLLDRLYGHISLDCNDHQVLIL